MLQGAAAYYSTPVYGQSHYKKFWLKKMETEDEHAASSTPTNAVGGGGGGGGGNGSGSGSGGVQLRNTPPPYTVNCSALEMKGTSPPPAAVRAAATLKSAEKKIKWDKKSELDYTLALGVGVNMEEDEAFVAESCDGFSSGEEKFDKCGAAAVYNSVAALQEETQPLNPVCFNSNGNGNSPRPVMRVCADCKTVKTPLWRNGPQGPKSLCNACGIRYKKLGKRPSSNGDRPSSPSTPPISPSGKQVAKQLHGKRKRETTSRQACDQQQHHHHRKKIKALGGLERRFGGGPRSSIRPTSLRSYSSSPTQSETDPPRVRDYGGDGNRSGEALRRWREVERIRKGLVRYGKLRSMAKDEEEGAVLLMALSCGVASC